MEKNKQRNLIKMWREEKIYLSYCFFLEEIMPNIISYLQSVYQNLNTIRVNMFILKSYDTEPIINIVINDQIMGRVALNSEYYHIFLHYINNFVTSYSLAIPIFNGFFLNTSLAALKFAYLSELQRHYHYREAPTLKRK